ncbi:hypothetical protein J2W49_004032 [Hydrogenophaga palleronii]|uniref:PNPLA domain-containing protein n=1 Tax=Hydrogenophaga palleronii TaxID=65655 RepID=A0ABU1WSX2_9BURK|nr:patatin-like phospholipase family protein [Hydrogenophaga palleronii]MDR7152056.1 hypothetical protein [Hydrogenophaga palleronii]
MSIDDLQASQPYPSDAQAEASKPTNGGLRSLVQERRSKLEWDDQAIENPDLWGLALSGGGIRSATFCFGLLKALAHNHAFQRFDLLSTVSGGGYIGATVGKLFQNAAESQQSAKEVEEALADADARWFGFWLRANGRYLIPNGTKDTIFAVANFSRNLIGVHVEVALLGLLLGCLLIGFDLALWQWADCLYSGNACWQPAWMSMSALDMLSRVPTIWVFLPPVALAVALLAVAYWALPSDQRANGSVSVWRWGVAITAGAALYPLLALLSKNRSSTGGLWVPGWVLLAVGGMLAAMALGTLLASLFARLDAKAPERSHNRITRWLASVLAGGLSIAGLGVLDTMAWQLAKSSGQNMVMVGTAVALTLAVLRAVIPKIADLPRSLTPTLRRNVILLVHVAGALVLFMVLVFWVSVLHRSVTMSLFNAQAFEFKLAWSWWIVITVPVLFLMGMSYFNRDFLNRSSLFSFYRARLVRSYLGAGNAARSSDFVQRATERYRMNWAAGESGIPIQDLNEGDDIPMADYAPHRSGGPVHLINACINQTRDPHGGMFNQDRKGQLLTLGPFGCVRVGQGPWREVQREGSLTLGSWVAMSGAAVAPGLGSTTRSGISALLTLSGLRLGYWWNSLAMKRDLEKAAPRHFNKYPQLLAELRGRFEGIHRAEWFLSDGGHFENTAAYALLREECKLVVLADCGADPRYAFGDLENLVRKARIDLQANIIFLRPCVPPAAAFESDSPPESSADTSKPRPSKTDKPTVPPAFGSLNDLTSQDSQACLALARIEYPTSVGYLIVVKPNVVAGAPVDLVNFKADNPLFPQEPTTDQFFNEAQWESYFLLGRTLGQHLTPELLRQLPMLDRIGYFEVDDGSVIVRDESGKVHATTAPKRLPSRIAATGAVTASVSLGALATFGTAAWQAVSQHMEERAKTRAIDATVLKDLTDVFGRLPPVSLNQTSATNIAQAADANRTSAETSDLPQVGEMATALLRVGESCKPSNSEAFRNSELLQLILKSTFSGCEPGGLPHPSCALLKVDNPSIDCMTPSTKGFCEPKYGLRDFSTNLMNDDSGCLKSLPMDWSKEFSGWPWSLWSKTASEPVLPDTGGTGPSMPSMDPSPGQTPNGSGSDVDGSGSSTTDGAEPIQTKGPDRGERQEAGEAKRTCAGRKVYIQIFGPEMRDAVRDLREPWRAFGANVPPIEDVLDTARRRDRSPPLVPKNPVAIYHDTASKECAELLQPLNVAPDWEVRALPRSLTAVPGVIEIWLPPGSLPIQERSAFSTTSESRGATIRWEPKFGHSQHTSGSK